MECNGLLEREVNFQQKQYNTSNHTFSMLPRYLAKVTSLKFVVIYKKKQSESLVTFDKNWNVSCHTAEYCHAQQLFEMSAFCLHTCAKTSMPLFNCIVNDGLSGQCHAKHAENAASVHNTCLDKIVCYLQRICNRNRKMKQQVSK